MKKHVLKFAAAIALLVSVTACKSDKSNEATTTEAETTAVATKTAEKYTVNVNDSSIEWKGFKPTGSHNGTIKIETGTLSIKDGAVESGTFLINMKSITVLDMDEEGNADLKGHLSNEDFFDVEKFPSAAFNVTGFSNENGKAMLSGNLTMKGVKNNITFPVTISESGNEVKLVSEPFKIDRTKWGIKYKSKSIFGDLGDKFINDDMEIKVNLKAAK